MQVLIGSEVSVLLKTLGAEVKSGAVRVTIFSAGEAVAALEMTVAMARICREFRSCSGVGKGRAGVTHSSE